ncbi:hypothetical protein ACQP60_19030 [Isoptericola variabilis]|uniref:hypothetical protein n=1 Tax=Isoptericola variabilis TaxID=139208 RepID=UPI003D1A363D
MIESEARSFTGLIEHHDATPRGQKRLPAAVSARCTARTYGGDVVTLEGVVTHRAPGLLAFSAEYPGWGQWAVWVRPECCEPL